MTTEEIKEKAKESIDSFIMSWCHGNHEHLLDSDENDGERLRGKIDDFIDQAINSKVQSIREEIEKCTSDAVNAPDDFKECVIYLIGYDHALIDVAKLPSLQPTLLDDDKEE